jgi:flagellar P-ring protein precursor FlgI
VTSGFVAGRGANSLTVNHPTVGRVPNGAIIERPAPSRLPQAGIKLQLREADFITASRIAKAVNSRFAAGAAPIAHAENSGLVSVTLPATFASNPTDFVAEMETLTVPLDRSARVVVNERTGTIVLGKDVRIGPVAILQGNLTVEIKTTLEVSQPAPLASGTTQVVPETSVGVKQERARNVVLKQGATVEELVRALTAIGASARDVIAILQSLHAAGALDADLEVI